MTSEQTIMGVDIGGTGIKAGLVDINKGVVTGETVYEPTPQPAHPDDTVAAVARVVEQFGWRGRIGIGYPGVVKQGVALSAANLTDNWLEQNLQELFGVVTNDEVVVLNDADAAGLAEMQFGAGKDHFNLNGGLVFMCTFGTGIGSALFYHGILIPNMEFGHIEVDGVEAEAVASGSARTREELSWEEWGVRADRYLREMEKLLSFDLVIVGGGISENFDKFRPYLHLRAEIRQAEQRNNAGIIGAALAARP